MAGGDRIGQSPCSSCSASTWPAGSRACGTPLTGIGLGYLVAGWSLQTLQTTLTALGWYFILRAGYPDAPRAVPAGARRLRRRRRAERLPAGQHRHVRDVADVRRDHPRREPPRCARRRCWCRRSSSRSPARSSTCTCSRPCRARSSASSSCRTTIPAWCSLIVAGAVLLIAVLRRDLPAQAARPDREGQAGRRDPRAPARLPGACRRCRRSARGWPSSA